MKVHRNPKHEEDPSTVVPYATGFGNPRTYTTAVGGKQDERSNQSDEDILLGISASNDQRAGEYEQTKQIRVTEEYQVTRS